MWPASHLSSVTVSVGRRRSLFSRFLCLSLWSCSSSFIIFLEEIQLENEDMLPRWLQLVLTEKFFNACIVHEEARKNEKNIFCLDCCISLCPHCFSTHSSHRLLQIRRYVYHDVIRLEDAAKLMDCEHVQSYTTNSAKVIFINQRPATRQFRGSGNNCSTCDRSLQEPYHFCSLYCKINYLLRTRGGLSGFLFDCKFLPLSDSGLDDDLMTPDSVLEPAGSTRTSSGSEGQGGASLSLACTATTEVVRKKRSSLTACRSACSPVSEVSRNDINRRKKTPQRAPLY